MPRMSVGSGTRQRANCQPESGSAIRLPTSSASPVSKNGGTWLSATPSVASVPHRAMAPSASHCADITAAGR